MFLAVILTFMTDVTQILSQIDQNDASTADQLLPRVHDERTTVAHTVDRTLKIL